LFLTKVQNNFRSNLSDLAACRTARNRLTLRKILKMANKRQAKKLVIELSNQVISDCFNYLQLHPEKDNSDVLEIIDEVQQLRDELVMRMNHISGSDNPKLVKDYFRTIYK